MAPKLYLFQYDKNYLKLFNFSKNKWEFLLLKKSKKLFFIQNNVFEPSNIVGVTRTTIFQNFYTTPPKSTRKTRQKPA